MSDTGDEQEWHLLVMGDHLMDKESNLRVGCHIGSHTTQHVAVHGVNTRGKLLHFRRGSILCIADEAAWANLTGQLKVIQRKGSTRCIEFSLFIVLVLNGWRIVHVDSLTSLQKLDATRHELMNLYLGLEKACVRQDAYFYTGIDQTLRLLCYTLTWQK